MTRRLAARAQRVTSRGAILHRGQAGTRAHSRELTFDHRGIAVHKRNTSSAGQEIAALEARPVRPRQGPTDTRLTALYQDTLEAPIPQDMLSLLEKLGTVAR
jgi:hypothetical protein